MYELIPLKKALIAIMLSILIVTGSTGIAILYFRHVKEKQRQDPAFNIVALVQTSPDREGLKTIFLAQLLDLSIDRPTNLYHFNSKEAQQKLLACPVIKEAVVKKIRPGTIHVDYELRKPIAFLGDYINTAIDAEGVIFPIKPFFTPKKLPEIFLGNEFDETEDQNGERIKNVQWGMPLHGKRKELAFTLLDLIVNYCCDDHTTLLRIDVSKSDAPSYGQQQIILMFEDRIDRVFEGNPISCTYPRILRLSPDNYKEQLANYLVLHRHLREKDSASFSFRNERVSKAKATIIDLRLSELAFIGREP